MGAAHWPTNRAECFLPKHLSVAEAAWRSAGSQIEARRNFGRPFLDFDGAFALLRSFVSHNLHFYRFVLIRILQESDHARGISLLTRAVARYAAGFLSGFRVVRAENLFPDLTGGDRLIRDVGL